jgi:bacteriorhodopsin
MNPIQTQTHDQKRLMSMTFYITYVLLITTGTITFIEALRSKTPAIRHIMNVETCISIVAAYFYGQFLKKLERTNVDYADINLTRYTDWFITTPLMILAISLVFAHNNAINKSVTGLTGVTLSYYAAVLAADVAMLLLGFAGETARIERTLAGLLSFGAFAVLLSIMYMVMVRGTSTANYVLFALFATLWSLYGLVYIFLADHESIYARNTCYNVLDVLSKCIMGILFWAYFAHVIIVA